MTPEMHKSIYTAVEKFGRAAIMFGFCLAAFIIALLNGHWIWMVLWLLAAIVCGFWAGRRLWQIEDILEGEA